MLLIISVTFSTFDALCSMLCEASKVSHKCKLLIFSLSEDGDEHGLNSFCRWGGWHRRGLWLCTGPHKGWVAQLDQKALALKLCSNHKTSGQRKMGRTRSKPEVSSAQDYKQFHLTQLLWSLCKTQKRLVLSWGLWLHFFPKSHRSLNPPSTQMSSGNESPVKQFVTTETLSVARALGAITTKPVTKYSCSKANLHTRPWNSGAVSEKWGAGKIGMEMLDKRSYGNLGSLEKGKMQCCLPVW